MGIIEINKNVPIPNFTPEAKNRIYPFNTMKVGDSFFVKGKKRATIRAAAYSYKNYNQKTDFNFIIRDEKGGLRVWRTK